jgi:hypothetical protein
MSIFATNLKGYLKDINKSKKMDKAIQYIKKQWVIIAGAALGALGGYLYWHFIGCNSGTCPITSSPINSTLYGILLGGLLGSMLKKEKKREEK